MDNQNLQLLVEIVGARAANALGQKYKTLTEIAKADLAEIQRVQGIGPAKAKQIKSALELAGRLSRETLGESPVLDNPEAVANILRDETRSYRTEAFHVLLLNTRKRLIRTVQVATGTLDTLLVHAREVFNTAITSNASAIVLAHNHPSGDPGRKIRVRPRRFHGDARRRIHGQRARPGGRFR